MKRRALLIYGHGPGADPLPYNNHSEVPFSGSTEYGIHSDVDVDNIDSGTWKRTDCHNPSSGYDVGGLQLKWRRMSQ
jgi:hypothetical protein